MSLADSRWWNALPAQKRERVLTLIEPLARARRPRWGNLRRRRPFSECYGYDRGSPVDRQYIERFLNRHAQLITGDVLEVRSADYSIRYGTGVVRSHVLDIDPTNAAATIVGDLCDQDTLPPVAFDCVVLTQTLQFVRDPELALRNAWASLRPGGSLLVTVPSLGRVDPELPESDFWRWTSKGLRVLLGVACPDATIQVGAGGNLMVAISALLGLAVEDLREADRAPDDPAYPVVAFALAAKAHRPSATSPTVA